MDAQHNGEGRSDGFEASLEIPLNGGNSGTAKVNLRANPGALAVLVVGLAVILSKGDALERLLDAVPALAERFGDRLVAVA
jgi:hypothetical protein